MSVLSNWREEFNLSEVVTGKMTDNKALKTVTEKDGINNKVTINPKLDEAVKEIGGEVIGMVEQDTTAQKQRIDMKQGDKMKVIKTVTTVEGTLYKGEIVKFQEAVNTNGDYRVKDSMGRIWFIKKENLE